jgi:hypothetical protein
LKTKEGIEEGLDFIVCDNDFANLEKLLSK